ncbi:hypothetical protein LCGC14_2261630 [marine sediment metagenome]|uniref:Uncharacterized protein n=1 Tax=marine sediment metagenome TaxID=412755 RepID=A0A0F9FUL7_9ZZZZ
MSAVHLLEINMINKEQKLENPDSCPKCGASMNDIDWDGPDIDGDTAVYNGHCDKCDCVFTQENRIVYSLTTWEE